MRRVVLPHSFSEFTEDHWLFWQDIQLERWQENLEYTQWRCENTEQLSYFAYLQSCIIAAVLSRHHVAVFRLEDAYWQLENELLGQDDIPF